MPTQPFGNISSEQVHQLILDEVNRRNGLTNASNTPQGNPFWVDPKPAPPAPSGVLRRAGDTGLSLLKGAIGVPEFAVGLADMATGGYAGKGAEALGFQPKKAKEIIDTWLTPEQQLANKKLQEAKGFTPHLMTALQNPSTILNSVAESLPLMLGGAGIGRGLMKVAPTALAKLGSSIGVSAEGLAGSLGEGITGAGSAAESIRQEMPDGTLGLKQVGSAALSGLGTAAFGIGGNKLAGKLGIADFDESLVKGSLRAAGRTTDDMAAATPGMLKRIGGGALSEGVFEELPQSMQEQAWQNVGLNKPLMEGVPEAGAMGILAGGAMGMGAGGFTSRPKAPIVDNSTATDITNEAAPSVDDQIRAGMAGPISSGVQSLNGRVMASEATVQPSLFDDTAITGLTDAPVGMPNPDAVGASEDFSALDQFGRPINTTQEVDPVQQAAEQRFYQMDAQAKSPADIVKAYNQLNKEASTHFIKVTDSQEIVQAKQDALEVIDRTKHLFEQAYGTQIDSIAKGIKTRNDYNAKKLEEADGQQPSLFSYQGPSEADVVNAENKNKQAKEKRVAAGTFEATDETLAEEVVAEDMLAEDENELAAEPVATPVTPKAKKAPKVVQDDLFGDDYETDETVSTQADKDLVAPITKKENTAAKKLGWTDAEIEQLSPSELRRSIQGGSKESIRNVKYAEGEVAHVQNSPETIQKVVATVNKLTGGKAKIQWVDGKFTRKDEATGKDVELKGETADNLIKLVHSAKDVLETARHESIHALKNMGLFTKQEWNILSAKANGWIKQFNIDKTYSHLSKEAQIEEAIAHAFASPEVKNDSLLNRIKEVLEQLWNAIRGRGLQSASGVMSDVDSGKIGARDWDGRFRDTYSKPAIATEEFRDQFDKLWGTLKGIKKKPIATDSTMKTKTGNISISYKEASTMSFENYVNTLEAGYKKETADKYYEDLIGKGLSADVTTVTLKPITTDADYVRSFKAFEAYDNAIAKYVQAVSNLSDAAILNRKLAIKGYGKPLSTVGDLRMYSKKMSAHRAGVEKSFNSADFTTMLRHLNALEIMGIAPKTFYDRAALIKAFTFKHLGSTSEVLLPEWLIFTDSLMYKNFDIHKKAWNNQVNFYLGIPEDAEHLKKTPVEHLLQNKLMDAVKNRLIGKTPNQAISLEDFGPKERNFATMAILRKLQELGVLAISEPYGKPIQRITIGQAQRMSAEEGGISFQELKDNSEELNPDGDFGNLLDSIAKAKAVSATEETTVGVGRESDNAFNNEYGPLEALRDMQEVPEINKNAAADTKGHTTTISQPTDSMNPHGTKDLYALMVKPNALVCIIRGGRASLKKQFRREFGQLQNEYNKNGDRNAFILGYIDLVRKNYEAQNKLSSDGRYSPKVIAYLQKIMALNENDELVERTEIINNLQEEGAIDIFEKFSTLIGRKRHVNKLVAPISHTFALNYMTRKMYIEAARARDRKLDNRSDLLQNVANLGGIHAKITGIWPISLPETDSIEAIYNYVVGSESERKKFTDVILTTDEETKLYDMLLAELTHKPARERSELDKLVGNVSENKEKPLEEKGLKKNMELPHKDVATRISKLLVRIVEKNDSGAYKVLDKFIGKIKRGFASYNVKEDDDALQKLIAYIEEAKKTRVWSPAKVGHLSKLLKQVQVTGVPIERTFMYTPDATINLGSIFKDYINWSKEKQNEVEEKNVPLILKMISDIVGKPVAGHINKSDRGHSLIMYLSSNPEVWSETNIKDWDAETLTLGAMLALPGQRLRSDINNDEAMSATAAIIISDTFDEVNPEKLESAFTSLADIYLARKEDEINANMRNYIEAVFRGESNPVANAPTGTKTTKIAEAYVESVFNNIRHYFTKEEVQDNPELGRDIVGVLYQQVLGESKQKYVVKQSSTDEFNWDMYEVNTNLDQRRATAQENQHKLFKEEQLYNDKINNIIKNALRDAANYVHGYKSSAAFTAEEQVVPTSKYYISKDKSEKVRIVGYIENFYGKRAVKIQSANSVTAEVRIVPVKEFEQEYTQFHPSQSALENAASVYRAQEFTAATEGISKNVKETLVDFLINTDFTTTVDKAHKELAALNVEMQDVITEKMKDAPPNTVYKQDKEARARYIAKIHREVYEKFGKRLDLLMAKYNKITINAEVLAQEFASRYEYYGMNEAEATAAVAEELDKILNSDPEYLSKTKAAKRVKETYKNPRIADEFSQALQALVDRGFLTAVTTQTSNANRYRTTTSLVATKKLLQFILEQKAVQEKLGTDKAAIANINTSAVASFVDSNGQIKVAVQEMKKYFPGTAVGKIIDFVRSIFSLPFFKAQRFKEFMPMMLTSMRKVEFIDKWKNTLAEPLKEQLVAMQQLIKTDKVEYDKLTKLFVAADALNKKITKQDAMRTYDVSAASYALFEDTHNTIEKVMPTLIARGGASVYMAKFQGLYKNEAFADKLYDLVGKHGGTLSTEEVRTLAKDNIPAEFNDKWGEKFVKHAVGYNDWLKQTKQNITSVSMWMPRIRKIDKVSVKVYNEDKDLIGVKYFATEAEASAWKAQVLAKDLTIFEHNNSIPKGELTAKLEFTGATDLALFSTMDSAQEFDNIKSAMDSDSGFAFSSPAFGNGTLEEGRTGGEHLVRRTKDLIVGYDTDSVYANYATALERIAMSFARLEYGLTQFGNLEAVREQAAGDQRLAAQIPEYVEHLRHDLKRTTPMENETQKLKNTTVVWFMGFKLLTPLVNSTQPFISGMPEMARMLSKINGKGYAANLPEAAKMLGTWIKRAGGDAVNEYLSKDAFDEDGNKRKWNKDMFGHGVGALIHNTLTTTFGEFTGTKDTLSEHHKEALKKFSRGGLLRGMFNDLTLTNDIDDTFFKREEHKNWQKFTTEAMKAFQITEIINREGSFLAAFDMYYNSNGNNFDKAYNDAQEFVYKTQYMVNKFNMPIGYKNVGALGSAAYSLMSFPFNMINQMFNMGGELKQGDKSAAKALFTMMGMIMMLGGAGALPFKDLIEFLYKHILHKAIGGTSGNLDLDARNAMKAMGAPNAVQNLIMYGTPTLVGASISGNLAMKTPFVGGIFNNQGVAETAMGASGAMFNKLKKAGEAASRGDIYKSLENIAPEFVAAPLREYRQYKEGATNKAGRPQFYEGKQVKHTGAEAVAAGLFGVRSSRNAELTERRNTERELAQQIADKRARAMNNPKLIPEFNKWLISSGLLGLGKPIKKYSPAKPNESKTAWEMRNS